MSKDPPSIPSIRPLQGLGSCLALATCLPLMLPLMAADPGTDRAIWRFEFHNDFFLQEDDGLTAGGSLQRHTAPAPSWDTVRAPNWLTGVGEKIPCLDDPGDVKRFAIGIGQLLQTPDDLTISEPQPDDVPYAATLGVFASWTAVSAEEVAGLQVYLGMVGPPALGQEAQEAVHLVTGSADPEGWDNQIGFEPLLNIDYGHWWRLADWADGEGLDADCAGGGMVGLGNLRTGGEALVQLRLGWNLPEGFASIPDPGGRGIAQLPRLAPPDQPATFLTIGARGIITAYTIFLDGSMFDHDEPEAPDREIGYAQAILGIHHVRQQIALRVHWVLSTDPINGLDGSRNWGAATVEWSF